MEGNNFGPALVGAYGALLAVARRTAVSEPDAQDLAQEAIARLLARRATGRWTYAGDRELQHWLFTRLRGLHCDTLARARRLPCRTVPME